jgi:hypothetical protein
LHRRQRVQHGYRAIELPTAMVGHDDAVGAHVDGALCVVGVQDFLNVQRALP